MNVIKQNVFQKQRKTKYKKRGILYFCGCPASYVKYECVPVKKLTITQARKRTTGVARCPSSFRPSLNRLKKRTVYHVNLYFDAHHKLVKIQIISPVQKKNTNTFVYEPIV